MAASATSGFRAAGLLPALRQDVGYAFRGLARNPGFSTTAILTLALGIGASAAMFSVVHSVLLRPLPYTDPSRLVTVSSVPHRAGGQPARTGYADIESWRQSTRTLTLLAACDAVSVVIEDPAGHARRVTAVYVTANVFELLGVAPSFGRAFTAEEAERREPVAVLSHDFWREHFAARGAELGSPLVVNGRPHRVLGVMPPGFRSPDPGAALLLPETLHPSWDGARGQHGSDFWNVIARLAPGATLEQARAEFTALAAALEKNFPATNAGVGVAVTPLSLAVAGPQLRLALFTLVGAVGAVLLIACSNVAGLLLARGAARQREFAVRAALGAGRTRLVVQLLVENLVLALLAAALGAALAAGALHLLRAHGPADLPRLGEIALDGAALAFAAGLSLVSAVASGLVPALRTAGRDPMAPLRSGRGLSDGPAARRLRGALVATEFALAIVLLAATALLGRSLAKLAAVDTGYRADNALILGLTYPRHRPAREIVPFMERLLERTRAVPGVHYAGLSEEVLLGEASVQPVLAEGAAEPLRLPMRVDAISPDYFRAVGVPLLEGRFFNGSDDARATPVAIVNEILARRLWPDGRPLGRRLREGGLDSQNPWVTVVGVVADLRRQGPDRPPVAQMFQPHTQRSTRSMNLVVATDLEPSLLAGTLRAVVAEVDRGVPVSTVTTLRAALDGRLAQRRFTLGLIGAFAGSALVLAGIGIFGLISYSVSRRTQEIGVRMALGARPGDVLRLVLGEGLRLALAGLAAGLSVGALLLPALGGLLFETSLADPLSLGGAIALLLAVALFACWLPARRAVRVNPVTALRTE